MWVLAVALYLLPVLGCYQPGLDETEKEGLLAGEDGLITGKVDSGAAIPAFGCVVLLCDLHLSYQLFGIYVGSRDHCIAFTLFPMVASPSVSAVDDGVSVDSSTCLFHGHLPVSPGCPVLHKAVI